MTRSTFTRATVLPGLRRALIDHHQSREGRYIWQRTTCEMGMFGLDKPGLLPTAKQADHLLEQEIQRLRMAELYFVTEDMTQLAVMAGATFPSLELNRPDLPAEFGFIVFAAPIAVARNEDGRSAHIVACAWGERGPIDESDRRGVWLSFYTDTRVNSASDVEKGLVSADEAHRALALVPALQYDSESWWAFNDSEMRLRTNSSVESAVHTVRATWSLMQQEIASVHRFQPRKAELRALRRKKLDPTAVRIISLRHRKTDPVGDSADGRTYSHRWIVRGHWRQQPCGPGRTQTRPVWINAHVKGPDGAPMLTGEVVNAWRR